MTSSFGQAGTWLTGAAAQQTDLQRAVAAGELWMEAGVAERAPAFTSFFDNTVNGRTGAHFPVERDRTDCT